jgi:hypothetical protein
MEQDLESQVSAFSRFLTQSEEEGRPSSLSAFKQLYTGVLR